MEVYGSNYLSIPVYHGKYFLVVLLSIAWSQKLSWHVINDLGMEFEILSYSVDRRPVDLGVPIRCMNDTEVEN